MREEKGGANSGAPGRLIRIPVLSTTVPPTTCPVFLCEDWPREGFSGKVVGFAEGGGGGGAGSGATPRGRAKSLRWGNLCLHRVLNQIVTMH